MDGWDPDEDVLDTGSAWGRPVARVLAGLAGVGVLVGLLVHANSGPPAAFPPVAAPAPASASASTPAAVLARPASLTISTLGPPLRPRISSVRDLATGADRLYVLRRGGLLAYDLTQQRVVARVAAPELASSGYHLVVNIGRNAVWAARFGAGAPTTAIQYDATSLAQVGHAQVPAGVRAAAVLDGRVFVATAAGVREIGAAGVGLVLPSPSGAVQSLAADQRRDRLLLLVSDVGDAAQTRLVAEGLDGRLRVEAAVPLSGGQVVALRDAIWVGGVTGLSGRHAEIMRLDPDSLTSTGSAAPLAARLGPGAEFVAAGSRVVWVRGAATGDLWCMDGATGAAAQRFPASVAIVVSLDSFGPVTARESYAFAAVGGALRPLSLQACAG